MSEVAEAAATHHPHDDTPLKESRTRRDTLELDPAEFAAYVASSETAPARPAVVNGTAAPNHSAAGTAGSHGQNGLSPNGSSSNGISGTVAAGMPVMHPAPSAVYRTLPTPAAPIATAAVRRPLARRVMRLAAGALSVAGVICGGLYFNWARGPYLAQGLVIQGEPVGGLTREEAAGRLQRRFGRLFVTVATPTRPYRLALRQLGGQPRIDTMVQGAYWLGRSGSPLKRLGDLYRARREGSSLSLGIKWHQPQLRSTMWQLAASYRVEPRNATLKVSGNGVEIVPHQEGRALLVKDTVERLQRRYYPGLPAFTAVTREVTPGILAADLVGQDVQLGRFTTSFNSGLWGRTRNIHIAAAAIHGKVLMPGQAFSFNQQTGERTWDKGYRMAHIFERKPGQLKSEVVDGLAGGVCQVSTTLYNAVRKTNDKMDGALRIIERNYHSLPVTYVPSGLDATVAWPNRDFRFRNTLQHPVYVRAVVSGSRVTISMWARVPEQTPTAQVALDQPADSAL